MEQFVSNITFKSDSYEGSYEFATPIKFDNNKYNYFIKILNVRFSNNIANIYETKTLTVTLSPNASASSGVASVSIPEGIYEIDDIVNLVNEELKLQLGNENLKFVEDAYTGHMQIINSNSSTATLSGSLLQTIQLGEFPVNVVVNANDLVISPKVISVSEYNFFKLLSNAIAPTSYEPQGDKFITSNTLYTFSSAIGKFGYKDYTAFQNIVYPLNYEQLQRLDFELTDENEKKLKLLSGAKSDFNIQALIIRTLKI